MDPSQSYARKYKFISTLYHCKLAAQTQICFLCNIGDMLSTWTGGLYGSTKHRVQHDSNKMRVSVPFFFDPNMDALISPILPNDGNKPESEGILYREKFIQCVKYSVID